MRLYEAAGIGTLLGLLYGITLWASMDALAQASFILYGNIYKIPFVTTGVITILAFGCLFSYQLWTPYAEQIIIEAGEQGIGDNKE